MRHVPDATTANHPAVSREPGQWPHLDVWLNSVTEHWAATVVTGPRARDVLAGLVADCDLSNDAFPHLA